MKKAAFCQNGLRRDLGGGGGGWVLKRKVLRRVLCVCMRGGGGEELGCLPVWLVINF